MYRINLRDIFSDRYYVVRGSELPLFSKVLYKLVLWLKGKSNAHIDQINLNILNNKQACMTSLLNHSLVERKDELVFDQW